MSRGHLGRSVAVAAQTSIQYTHPSDTRSTTPLRSTWINWHLVNPQSSCHHRHLPMFVPS